MEKKVLKIIEKYDLINKNDKLILGVSGGPDSICMLDILDKIKKDKILDFEIIVAHVNHLIREEAKDDENYVKEFCRKRDIKFYSKSIDILKIGNIRKVGTEEAGRDERYKYFNQLMKETNSNKIAIAHNKNDNIETIIMHILRGSGISGLKGIEPKNNKYIRPLIECTREEIEKYCEINNLKPRIDKTNFENIYTRNKIRNIVLPYIKKEFNPNIIETIDRLSKLVKEEDEYIKKQVEKIYTEIMVEEKIENENLKRPKEIILDLKKFNSQEKVIKSRIILYTITRIFGNSKGIEQIHVEDIIKLCSNNIGNKYLTPNKNIKILVKSGQIHFINQQNKK